MKSASKKTSLFEEEISRRIHASPDFADYDPFVEYQCMAGAKVKDVTEQISEGPRFHILCVLLGCNDLVDNKNKVVQQYPQNLDNELKALATAVRDKATKALFMVGGDATLWGYPNRWDDYINRMHATLTDLGAKVVPKAKATDLMQRMELSKDKIHFSNDDNNKKIFANAWITWLRQGQSTLMGR